jgi:hypothetical protein
MGSPVAARAKRDELKRWAEQVGEILSKRAFGEDGPDLKTSLADLEQLLGPLLEQVAAGFLRASVTQQAERLPQALACPTCGQGCSSSAGDPGADDDDRARGLRLDGAVLFLRPLSAVFFSRCGRCCGLMAGSTAPR